MGQASWTLSQGRRGAGALRVQAQTCAWQLRPESPVRL